MGSNDILFEVASGVADAGLDLSYSKYRIGAGDLEALKCFVRERLALDDACDDARIVRIVAQLVLDGMSGQHEVDVQRLSARQIEEQSPAQGMMAGDTDDLEVKGQLLPKS
jgi:hypothetical protein